ncbi:alkaline phosphatase family protein [Yasminevirus sp. GU-2018]|uniref:Alkaline phosphatase family protein n=1 Tax=Yasminevirus sp. GU-2018 TaxID=2420051 RepID=A0A5K0U8A9_9VIRU|nr:alkaline phosphatase family protein [Yasminevirus sp. GU-2018]
MIFFHNGLFSIEEGKYVMNFLYDNGDSKDSKEVNSVDKTTNTIIIIKGFGDKIVGEQNIDRSTQGASKLSVVIDDPFLYKGETTYYRYTYKVMENGTNVLFEGSFPIIKESHLEKLRFGFVSCNDNVYGRNPEWNTYSQSNPSDLWASLKDKVPDIVVHMGDQIYADSVYTEYSNKRITLAEVYNYIQKLYRLTYSEPEQGSVMRNCLNITINDDHDFTDSAGSPGFGRELSDETYSSYHEVAKKAMYDYQQQMYIESSVVRRSSLFNSYALNLGKYLFIVLDTRGSLFKSGVSFSEELCGFAYSELIKTKSKDVLIVVPRPLINMSKFYAWALSKVVSEGFDDSLHPKSYDSTMKFRDMLFNFLVADRKLNIKMFSGDVHHTYLQTHSDTRDLNKKVSFDEMVTTGITRKSVSQTVWYQRVIMWLAYNANRLKSLGVVRRDHSYDSNYGVMLNDTLSNITKKF